MNDELDDKVYSFTLLDGRTLSGQVAYEELTWLGSGEIYILPLREGTSTTITYIPWKNVMSYKRL